MRAVTLDRADYVVEVKIGVVCQLGPERDHVNRTGRDPIVLGPRQYAADAEAADTFLDSPTVSMDEVRERLLVSVRILMIGDGGPWRWVRSQYAGL